MGKASSAKKVARLASGGKKRKVRFQGGILFPVLIVALALFGTGLIIYSRISIPNRNVAPTVGDHWHASFGFYACDKWLPNLQGNLEEVDSAGQVLSDGFRRTGIHSHDDGVMHWHPRSSSATGRNAKLGVFLNVYGISLKDKKLEFSADQGGAVYEEGVTKCLDEDGKSVDGELAVYAFKAYNTPDDVTTYITSFGGARLLNDGMAFSIVFAAPGVKPGLPPSAASLPTLGAADSGAAVQTTIPDATTVPGATTLAPATTVPGATTLAPATTVAVEPATTIG